MLGWLLIVRGRPLATEFTGLRLYLDVGGITPDFVMLEATDDRPDMI